MEQIQQDPIGQIPVQGSKNRKVWIGIITGVIIIGIGVFLIFGKPTTYKGEVGGEVLEDFETFCSNKGASWDVVNETCTYNNIPFSSVEEMKKYIEEPEIKKQIMDAKNNAEENEKNTKDLKQKVLDAKTSIVGLLKNNNVSDINTLLATAQNDAAEAQNYADKAKIEADTAVTLKSQLSQQSQSEIQLIVTQAQTAAESAKIYAADAKNFATAAKDLIHTYTAAYKSAQTAIDKATDLIDTKIPQVQQYLLDESFTPTVLKVTLNTILTPILNAIQDSIDAASKAVSILTFNVSNLQTAKDQQSKAIKDFNALQQKIELAISDEGKAPPPPPPPAGETGADASISAANTLIGQAQTLLDDAKKLIVDAQTLLDGGKPSEALIKAKDALTKLEEAKPKVKSAVEEIVKAKKLAKDPPLNGINTTVNNAIIQLEKKLLLLPSTIKIKNQADAIISSADEQKKPVLNIAISPAGQQTVGQPVTFTLTASNMPEPPPYKFQIAFDDNDTIQKGDSSTNQLTKKYTYQEAKTYLIQAKVLNKSDQQLAYGESFYNIISADEQKKPVLNIAISPAGQQTVGQLVTFTLTASNIPDSESSPYNYEITFGDGESKKGSVVTKGFIESHTYQEAKTYSVSAKMFSSNDSQNFIESSSSYTIIAADLGAGNAGGDKIPDPAIVALEAQIANLQAQLAAAQNNNNNALVAGLAQQIADLNYKIANLGGQQIVVNVAQPSGSSGGSGMSGSAPDTKCSDPTFTYDPVAKVCNPPSATKEAPKEDTTKKSEIIAAAVKKDSSKKKQIDTSYQDQIAKAEAAIAAELEAAAAAKSGLGGSVAGTGKGSAGSAKAFGASIQGSTGPGILLYPVILAGANGLYALLRRRRKSRK